eukprot:scaffold25251_cov65-Phaeocystis_antarctica.AAC.7
MALGDCTMSLKVTVAASIRVFISLFTASLISVTRAWVAKGEPKDSQRRAKQRDWRRWAGTRAPLQPHFGIQAARALLQDPQRAAVRKRAGFWSGGWPHGLLRARAF